jgi:hypothetical protein
VIKVKSKLDQSEGLIKLTRTKLMGFLSSEEVAETEIVFIDGKLNFKAKEPILEKIKAAFGKPSKEY